MGDDGLPSEEFKQFHDVTLPDGQFIFGGTGGYTIFDPARIKEDPVKPTVALTALRINNQLVNATTPDSPLQKDINETATITLSNHGKTFCPLILPLLSSTRAIKISTGISSLVWIKTGFTAAT